MEDLVFHIGIQRTGTTFLQQEVFPTMEDINLVNFIRHDGIKYKVTGIKTINNNLRNIHKIPLKTIKKSVNKRLKKDKINLISNENIWWSRKDDDLIYKKVDKIYSCFPDSKIIFGIRKQDSWISSMYSKYVSSGGILSFNDYRKNEINKKCLNFDEYISYLKNTFGEEKVFIYNFENLIKDTDSFIKILCNFLDIKKPNYNSKKRNIGYSLWQIKLSLLINHFFKNENNPKGLLPLNHKWHPHRIIFQSPFFPKKLRGKKATNKLLEKV